MGFEPGRPLAFMHIAKTSGTALTAGLTDALRPERALTGFDRVMFGGFSDFGSMADGARLTIFDEANPVPAGANFLHGHFAYSTLTRHYPEAQLMTVLREPRVRILSLWRFWRAQTPETMRGWGSWEALVRRSRAKLLVFLNDAQLACQTDNMAVRMLLWPHARIPEDGFIAAQDDSVILAAAQARLAGFAHVDIVENAALAQNLAGWLGRDFTYPRLNETGPGDARPPASLHEELSDEAQARLDHLGRLDRALWAGQVARLWPGTDAALLGGRIFVRAVAQYASA